MCVVVVQGREVQGKSGARPQPSLLSGRGWGRGRAQPEAWHRARLFQFSQTSPEEPVFLMAFGYEETLGLREVGTVGKEKAGTRERKRKRDREIDEREQESRDTER